MPQQPPRTRRNLVLALAFFALLAAGGPGFAFSPRTRTEIVRDALTLMPDSLERQLRRHARALYRGALETGDGEEGAGRHAAPDGAELELSQRIDALVQAIDGHAPMREVAYRFGRVAHAAADLSYSLNVGPDDPREARCYRRFARYVERKLDRIKVTFSGFEDPALARGDAVAFGRSVAARARRDYDGILRSFFPDGRKPTPADFDDRSIPFAAASLEVSLAVTATAKSWLFAWRRAHGDMAGAPLADRSPGADPFAPRAPAAAPIAQEEEKR